MCPALQCRVSVKMMKSRSLKLRSERKYQLQNNAIACTVTDIDEDVGPDKKVTITRTFDDIAVFSADMDRDSLVYGVSSVPDGEYYFAGIGKYYFGARYYDPELVLWTSRDAAGQFYSAYGYGNDPVLMVDEDGNIIGLLIGGYLLYRGISNVVHNWEGIRNGEWYESLGKGTYSFVAGAGGGAVDLASMAWKYSPPTIPLFLADRMMTGGKISGLFGEASVFF